MDVQEHSTSTGPLAWLNSRRMFRLRRIQFERVWWRGNNVVLILTDGRRVSLRKLSDALSPRKIQQAFAGALGAVLPSTTARAWEPYAAAIAQAAREDAERSMRRAA